MNGAVKIHFLQPHQRVDKLSTRWQTAENRGRFCENELVGVRWYGRVYFHKKRITPLFCYGTAALIYANMMFNLSDIINMLLRGLTDLSTV